MNVGVLIVTHGDIGSALLYTANILLQDCPVRVKLLPVSYNCDLDEMLNTATNLVGELDQGCGVLILTDLIGATPSNITKRINISVPVNIVSGINLSMLVRVMNYPDLSLAQLTEKAISGGIDGVELVCLNDR